MTDSPAAPDRSLTAQPASEDIRNALQIIEDLRAESVRMAASIAGGWDWSFLQSYPDAQRLLRHALAKLDGASGPPNPMVSR